MMMVFAGLQQYLVKLASQPAQEESDNEDEEKTGGNGKAKEGKE